MISRLRLADCVTAGRVPGSLSPAHQLHGPPQWLSDTLFRPPPKPSSPQNPILECTLTRLQISDATLKLIHVQLINSPHTHSQPPCQAALLHIATPQ